MEETLNRPASEAVQTPGSRDAAGLLSELWEAGPGGGAKESSVRVPVETNHPGLFTGGSEARAAAGFGGEAPLVAAPSLAQASPLSQPQA